MALSSDYRRYAQHYLDAAKRAPPAERKDLAEMTEAWLALASKAIAADMANSSSEISLAKKQANFAKVTFCT